MRRSCLAVAATALLLSEGVAAQRLVSLAPALTELVFAAGAGDRLVAVSSYSDYPLAARQLPVVSDAATVNVEAVLALKPDVILAWKTGTPVKLIESLRAAGLRVRVLDGSRLDDVPRLLREIGVQAGTREVADREAAAFESAIANIRKESAGRREVSVVLEIWHAPLTTIAGGHYMNDALAACGGRNVFAGLGSIAPEVSLESVVAADPEAVVGAGSALDEKTFRANWSRLDSLRAVKRNALLYLEPDTIQRQTPRILGGVRKLCEGLDRVRAAGAAPTQLSR